MYTDRTNERKPLYQHGTIAFAVSVKASRKMAKRKKLSERQQNILRFINEYVNEHGRPPTIREIGANVGISSTSVVNYNLNKLTEKGLLEREKEVSRGLKISEKAGEVLSKIGDSVGAVAQLAADITGMLRVPIVGDIVASEPIYIGHDDFSTYDDEDFVEISRSMLSEKPDELFALNVRGDSMIDAMVNDGDIVILKKQAEAKNGDMVAVWIDDGTMTLKHFYREGAQVRLQPAHPHMDPIYRPAQQVQVQGKVMMVIRQTA